MAESTPMPAPHAPSSRRYLKGTDGLLPLKPHLKRQTSISSLVLPPPPPRVSRKPRRKGCFRPLLGADDVAGPGLVLGAWSQMGDDHLHGLQLLVLGGNGAHLIGDLVAFHGDVLPFHTAGVRRQHSVPALSKDRSPCWSEGHPISVAPFVSPDKEAETRLRPSRAPHSQLNGGTMGLGTEGQGTLVRAGEEDRATTSRAAAARSPWSQEPPTQLRAPLPSDSPGTQQASGKSLLCLKLVPESVLSL